MQPMKRLIPWKAGRKTINDDVGRIGGYSRFTLVTRSAWKQMEDIIGNKFEIMLTDLASTISQKQNWCLRDYWDIASPPIASTKCIKIMTPLWRFNNVPKHVLTSILAKILLFLGAANKAARVSNIDCLGGSNTNIRRTGPDHSS